MLYGISIDYNGTAAAVDILCARCIQRYCCCLYCMVLVVEGLAHLAPLAFEVCSNLIAHVVIWNKQK